MLLQAYFEVGRAMAVFEQVQKIQSDLDSIFHFVCTKTSLDWKVRQKENDLQRS